MQKVTKSSRIFLVRGWKFWNKPQQVCTTTTPGQRGKQKNPGKQVAAFLRSYITFLQDMHSLVRGVGTGCCILTDSLQIPVAYELPMSWVDFRHYWTYERVRRVHLKSSAPCGSKFLLPAPSCTYLHGNGKPLSRCLSSEATARTVHCRSVFCRPRRPVAAPAAEPGGEEPLTPAGWCSPASGHRRTCTDRALFIPIQECCKNILNITGPWLSLNKYSFKGQQQIFVFSKVLVWH